MLVGAANFECQTAAMIERQIEITTPEGLMPTVVVHPEHGGPHPVVLYLMDAPGIRPALSDMASRLASAGYYVLMPYLYYRGAEFKRWDLDDVDMHARKELMDSIDPTNIVSDAQALFEFAANDPAADSGPAGIIGFCMSGGLAVSVARAFPERVKAAASIHGAWLVRSTADSPHLGLERLDAELHFAWCANDPLAPEEDRQTMQAALEKAGVAYTLDFHPDAEHGFAPAGKRYHRAASELHWERVHSLLGRNLGV